MTKKGNSMALYRFISYILILQFCCIDIYKFKTTNTALDIPIENFYQNLLLINSINNIFVEFFAVMWTMVF